MEKVIDDLFKVISGEVNIRNVEKIMSPKVVLHMDGVSFRGIQYWKKWVSFLRSRSPFKSLELRCERKTVEGDKVLVLARWRGVDPSGEIHHSDDVVGTFQIQNGQLVEIWSKKSNYTFILGKKICSTVFFLVYLPYIFLWCFFHPFVVQGTSVAHEKGCP